VIDSGTGMAPEIRERAFEPFFTTKEPGKGSGLGLAQVWGLAQQFGGTVLLDSAPGRGTTVRVFLPRATETALAGQAPLFRGTPELPKGRVILVVDDDADACDVAAAFLERDGYATRMAANGQEALASLEREDVSLALVDYAMPGMSGAEFVRRAHQRCPDLPVVFVTGNPDALAAEEAVEAPVLAKPYTREGLADAVRRALKT